MIVVSGDSFAWGSWGERTLKYGEIAENVPYHIGLAHFLIQDGHEVDILSKSGGGFHATFDQLKDYLRRKHPEKIFHFVTDSFRTDGNRYKWPKDKKITLENIKEQHTHRKKEHLSRLNSLGFPCVIIGGLTKIYPNDIIGLSNLSLGCSSMFEVVSPKFNSWEIYFNALTNQIIKNSEVDDKVVSYLENALGTWESIEKTNYVGSDGHPSPLAWEKLYSYLVAKGHIYKGNYKKLDEKTFIKLENEKQVSHIIEWYRKVRGRRQIIR